MQVILQENIHSLGKAGDVVSVRDGFARNFLLPQGKAVEADPKNLRMMEHHKRVIGSKDAKRKREAETLAEKLATLSLTISREAGEEEKIFGSVTAKDIADALRHEGYVVDKHAIVVEQPLKQLGIFDVPVKIHHEVTATVKVWVVKK